MLALCEKLRSYPDGDPGESLRWENGPIPETAAPELLPKLPPLRRSPFKLTTLDALTLLKADGIIKNLAVYNDQVIFCRPEKGFGWGEVTRRLSALVKGQGWAGANSLTHNPGGKNPCVYVMPRESIEAIEDARKIVKQLCGIEPRSYSMSGNARALLDWTGCKQKFTRPAELFLRGASHHFYYCDPQTLGDAYLWDIQSAFYALACRLPSPYVYVTEQGGPGFFECEPDKLERWQEMLKSVRFHKKLRNILIGCAGRSGSGEVFLDGKLRKGPRFDGPLRPAALLVIRTCYELTALAQMTENGVYANTDAIITPHPWAPRAWFEHGMCSRLVAHGPAEVCNIGTYRVGEHGTRWYWKGSRLNHKEHGTGEGVMLRLKGPMFLDWLKE